LERAHSIDTQKSSIFAVERQCERKRPFSIAELIMTDWPMNMFVSGILLKYSRLAASTQMLAKAELILTPPQT
jgi:hypothetical protein